MSIKRYNNQEVKVNGNVIHFDGLGDTTSKVLRIERFMGDIRLRDEAIQDFAMSNGYEQAVVKY